MEQQVSVEQAAKFAEKAHEAMYEHGVPPTPSNFAVWYHYFSGRFPDLTRTIEIHIANKRSFDAALNRELHDRFFGSENEANNIRQISSQIESTLGDVLDRMGEVGADADRYGNVLAEVSSEIDGADSSGVQKIVAKLVAETQRMAEQNDSLKGKLESSSLEINQLREDLANVRQEALTDALTGIANRKMFDNTLHECANAARENGLPLSLMLLDIDHFKKFNDTHGHQIGDKVLQLVAHTLTQCVKGRDLPARYGGEEFAVILPQTSLEDATTLADQVRLTVAQRKIVRKSTGQDLGTITMSIGVSHYAPGEPLQDLIERADEALYAAKNAGRNLVMTQATGPKIAAVAG